MFKSLLLQVGRLAFVLAYAVLLGACVRQSPALFPTVMSPLHTSTSQPAKATPTSARLLSPIPTTHATPLPTTAPTPRLEPTLKPTINASMLPDQLRSAIRLHAEGSLNNHPLRRVTGWDYGMRSTIYCDGSYRWLDNAHLLLYPVTGEEKGMGIDEYTLPIVINLNNGNTWLPVADGSTFSLPLWSDKLQQLISIQGRQILLLDPDGAVVQRYTGPAGAFAPNSDSNSLLSPSGQRLLTGYVWRDLTTGRTVDFSGQHKLTMGDPTWSSDETRLFVCCFGFADTKALPKNNFAI